jgi:ribonuclease HII
MPNLNEEQNFFNQGYKLIGGIDEAGRGPLAGPVVAACVVIGGSRDAINRVSTDALNIVNDSKKLSPKKREEAFGIIKSELDFGIGICDHETIDRINILQATFLAMKKALSAFKQKPDFILVDGKFVIPNLSIKQKAIIDGDRLVFSIAAASIIAKVARDRIMLEMHNLYPQYEFKKHKGYGTKLHLAALKKFGPSPIHRRSFRPVRNCRARNIE